MIYGGIQSVEQIIALEAQTGETVWGENEGLVLKLIESHAPEQSPPERADQLPPQVTCVTVVSEVPAFVLIEKKTKVNAQASRKAPAELTLRIRFSEIALPEEV
jgi:hypothetical protein